MLGYSAPIEIIRHVVNGCVWLEMGAATLCTYTSRQAT